MPNAAQIILDFRLGDAPDCDGRLGYPTLPYGLDHYSTGWSAPSIWCPADPRI